MNKKEYICLICNKKYASASSLWNHNKKFHNEFLYNNFQNNFKCKFCTKYLSRCDNLKRHEQNCRQQNDINKINELEIKKLKEENKNKILEIKLLKIQNKTTNNIINIQNNNIQKNIQIVNNGDEKYIDFSKKDINKIIKSNNILLKLTELINFNKKYPENHNINNTSLEGKYISVKQNNKFDKIKKKDFFNKLYNNYCNKLLGIIIECEFDKDKKNDEIIKILNNNLILLNQDLKYYKKYSNDINELSYNKKNLILKSINKKNL